MRILFLTPELPSPPRSGGTSRMHGLISNIAGRHDVAVLAYKPRGAEVGREIQETGAYAQLVVTVENPHLGLSNARKRLRQLRSLASRGSYERLTYGLAGMQRALDRACRVWTPDAIVVEFAQMGYFRFPEEIPVVLDAHNVEHEIVERLAGLEGGRSRRLYSRINSAKLRREEAELALSVDGLAVTSERDAGVFERIAPGCRPVVVPNGVDCRDFIPRASDLSRQSLLFFGALDYYPNCDAALYFAREIWPALRRAHPELEFEVVGRLPPKALQDVGSKLGIGVKGFVDDVRDSIAKATVVVVPLRAGSGTRLKVLEAMAMGKPVVSTSLGVEGLDVVVGEHLLVADDPEEFAGAVSSLLESRVERERLGRAARELVEKRYEWREIAITFEQLIESAVHSRQRWEVASRST